MINDSQLAKSLIDRGIADEAAIERGRIRQKKNDQSLFEALSIGKIVDDQSLLELASSLMKVPSVWLDSTEIEANVVALVPSSMAFRNRVFPVALRDAETLVLGMVDPRDILAMDEVSMHTGVNITPVLVSPDSMNRALDTHYGGHDELHLLDDGILDSISSLDVDSMVDGVISDESWVGFFDDPGIAADEISERMKDRANTGVLDIDSGEIEVDSGADLLAGLDAPIEPTPESRELDNWEVDQAIENASLGEQSSFILTKDSAEELFKQESEKIDLLDDDPNDQTRMGVAFAAKPTANAGTLKSSNNFIHEARTNVGVVQLGPDGGISSEFEDDATPPGGMPTSELQELERDRQATPISSLAVERSDPQTREFDGSELGTLEQQLADGESSLEEETRSADERVERISSLMKGFRKGAETVEAKAATSPGLKSISEAIDLELPNVNDRKLLETVVKILISQGTIDLNTLLTLLSEDDD